MSNKIITPKPFLKWAGGKQKSLDSIVPLFPKEVTTYWEPFLGGGAVAIRLLELNKSKEIDYKGFRLSDINQRLIQCWDAVINTPALVSELCLLLKTVHSKENYYKLRKLFNYYHDLLGGLPAALFIYLNKTGFNGLYRVNKHGQFNVPVGNYKFPAICQPELLDLISDLFQENDNTYLSYKDYLNISPQSNDFIYLDPPYYPIDESFVDYTIEGFDEKNQLELRDQIVEWGKCEIKVALSNIDCPEIRELYDDEQFNIYIVPVQRNIGGYGAERKKVNEVLITNYKLLSHRFNNEVP